MSESVANHPSVVRVRARLEELAVSGEITILQESARSAREAADALGVDLTLVVGEVPLDVVVGLPALEFFKWAEPGVGVIQADHIADGDFVVFHVVHEGTAVGVVVHGPAGGVHDKTRRVA